MCVSKAARGDGCKRFVNSAKESSALMFTKVTLATHMQRNKCTPTQKIVSSHSGRSKYGGNNTLIQEEVQKILFVAIEFFVKSLV